MVVGGGEIGVVLEHGRRVTTVVENIFDFSVLCGGHQVL